MTQCWRSGSMLSVLDVPVLEERPGKMEAAAWSLRRVGAERRGESLEIHPDTQVTVGRGFGVTHRLLPRNCPLMISRNHCAFQLTSEGQCTVTDNQSLNGVWVNGERIEPQLPFPLKEGDVIQLGVPLEHKERAEYEYRLARCEKVPPSTVEEPGSSGRAKRKHSCEEADRGGTEGPSTGRNKIQRVRDSAPPDTGSDPGCGSDPGSGTSREQQGGTAQRADTGSDPGSGTSREQQGGTAQRADTGPDPGSGTSRERAASSPTPVSGKLRAVSRARGQSAQELAVLREKNRQIKELSARVRRLERRREAERGRGGPERGKGGPEGGPERGEGGPERGEGGPERGEGVPGGPEQGEGGPERGEGGPERGEGGPERGEGVPGGPERGAEGQLQQLKERLCSEQEQQQQRVEQLERSFHEDQQQLEAVRKHLLDHKLHHHLSLSTPEYRELEVALSSQRKELEDIIRAKDRELEEVKVKAQREEAVAELTDVLENELQCIICSEYFIQ
uniref:E3 ubiquitin-protein ligase rnf8 n=1 Tax=Pristiophorus japonicus TaxID=55135 RepID=UPI00398F58EB